MVASCNIARWQWITAIGIETCYEKRRATSSVRRFAVLRKNGGRIDRCRLKSAFIQCGGWCSMQCLPFCLSWQLRPCAVKNRVLGYGGTPCRTVDQALPKLPLQVLPCPRHGRPSATWHSASGSTHTAATHPRTRTQAKHSFNRRLINRYFGKLGIVDGLCTGH